MRITLILLLFLTGCSDVWNDPYPAADRGRSILYSAFVERPKHLDPVQSYTSDEYDFIQQIYEHFGNSIHTIKVLTKFSYPKVRFFVEEAKASSGR